MVRKGREMPSKSWDEVSRRNEAIDKDIPKHGVAHSDKYAKVNEKVQKAAAARDRELVAQKPTDRAGNHVPSLRGRSGKMPKDLRKGG